MDDYYEILQVSVVAEPEVIVAAYRALVRKYHPDLHPDRPLAEQRTMRLNLAYETLSDPDRRENYDRERQRPRVSQSSRSGSVPAPPQYQERWKRARVLDARDQEHTVTVRALDAQGARVQAPGGLKGELRLVLSFGGGEPPLVLKVRTVTAQRDEYELRFWPLPPPLRERLESFMSRGL